MSDELADLKKKYEALQTEFTNFTYIVSHDLSAPIRHFREFSKMLFSSIEKHMTDETRQYEQFLNSSVKTLEEKLNVILKLSRVNTENWHFVELDSKEIFLSAIDSLLEQYEFDFQFSGEFPKMNIDFESCYTVFYNILENGIKFTEPQQKPFLQIHCSHSKQGKINFKISDNGIGIAESKIDSVFEIFKRLSHTYKGAGAGLTIAQKIMTRYAGEISLSSLVGEGTEVNILFPKGEHCQ